MKKPVKPMLKEKIENNLSHSKLMKYNFKIGNPINITIQVTKDVLFRDFMSFINFGNKTSKIDEDDTELVYDIIVKHGLNHEYDFQSMLYLTQKYSIQYSERGKIL